MNFSRQCPRFFSRSRLLVAVATVASGTVAHAAPSPNASKRGIGSGQSTVNNGMNANWYYNWGRTTNGSYGEFIPMAWGGGAVSNPTNLAQLTANSSEYILGFNEPERPDQANMSVAQAISLWPTLMATGRKLVSPAVSDTAAGRAWIQSFMAEIKANNYRVDAIAFHWYGDVRPANAYNNFLSSVDWYRNNVTTVGNAKLPVWITEFGGLDFSGGVDPVTPEMNEAFLAGALPGLDSRSYVERYAWWNWSTETTLGTGTPFTPSEAGHLYNGRTYKEGQTIALVGDEGDDTFYLRGGVMENAATVKTVRFVDAIDGFSEVQGSANWSVADGAVRIRTGATLRKYGTNTITFDNIPVYNDGQLFAKAGVIDFSDGTVVSGTGVIKTEVGSSIRLRGNTAATGVSITNDVQLAAGTLNVDSGQHELNGSLIVTNSGSGFIVNGNLRLNGAITGAGNLVKTGAGVFRVAGAGSNSGTTTISGGTLEVANTAGSATGVGPLFIAVNGTLAGDGLVGASLTSISGTLSPSRTGTRSQALTFTSPLQLLPTSISKFDVSTVAGDSVASTSSIAIAGSLQLKTLIAPSFLVPNTLLSASAVSGLYGTVAGADLGDGTYALAVTYTPTSVIATKTYIGDLTVNGMVDFADLVVLAQNYNLMGRTWSSGDVTGDGRTNFADLVALAQHYRQGTAVPSAAAFSSAFTTDWALAQALVPEPALATLLVGLCLPIRRRQRA